MAYRTTAEQRRPRLRAIADRLDDDTTAELLDLVDLAAPADELSPKVSAALGELREAFHPPAAPLFEHGQIVRLRANPHDWHVVDLPHLDPRAGWVYATREHPPASDDPGQVFREDELEPIREHVS